jgi:hypothetical protein
MELVEVVVDKRGLPVAVVGAGPVATPLGA